MLSTKHPIVLHHFNWPNHQRLLNIKPSVSTFLMIGSLRLLVLDSTISNRMINYKMCEYIESIASEQGANVHCFIEILGQ